MKKHRRLLLLILLIIVGSLAFLMLFSKPGNAGTRGWNISDLEMKNDSGYCEIISFEDAVRLKTKLNSSNNELAEKELRDLESGIFNLTGSNVSYYQFTGAFTFPEIKEITGELTTLIVVVDDQTPYIYEINQPITEISCAQSNVRWTQMSSSSNIGTDQTSARLAATGYLTISDGDVSAPDRLSNTIYPLFTFLLKN
ncbi:hypothetical protein [uncultured Oscillibacter sp.]|uniref:hypothetical protein n=1 Tax=uncultured Oscillibacter sp. TaxID=876091 RepID=UPI0025CC46ED|nr:hypothetical protein [uncultured Oscillibacter sp.]